MLYITPSELIELQYGLQREVLTHLSVPFKVLAELDSTVLIIQISNNIEFKIS